MLQTFNKIYKKQQFQPSWWAICINPFFIIRRALFKTVRQKTPILQGKMLDFGCGSKPYRSLIHVDEYVGLDMENPGHSHEGESIDVYYDGKTIPFANNPFDSVLSSEVFEHVFNLEEMLQEIHRVLKPGATGLFTTPFAWNEHEVPVDFGRYTSFGMKHLLERNGFEVISIDKTTSFFPTLIQLFSLYIFQLVKTKNKYLNVLITSILIMPINIVGLLLAFCLPRTWDYYPNLVVCVKKKA